MGYLILIWLENSRSSPTVHKPEVIADEETSAELTEITYQRRRPFRAGKFHFKQFHPTRNASPWCLRGQCGSALRRELGHVEKSPSERRRFPRGPKLAPIKEGDLSRDRLAGVETEKERMVEIMSVKPVKAWDPPDKKARLSWSRRKNADFGSCPSDNRDTRDNRISVVTSVTVVTGPLSENRFFGGRRTLDFTLSLFVTIVTIVTIALHSIDGGNTCFTVTPIVTTGDNRDNRRVIKPPATSHIAASPSSLCFPGQELITEMRK
jgi:hypothetical protein